jgi:hypothetical protein
MLTLIREVIGWDRLARRQGRSQETDIGAGGDETKAAFGTRGACACLRARERLKSFDRDCRARGRLDHRQAACGIVALARTDEIDRRNECAASAVDHRRDDGFGAKDERTADAKSLMGSVRWVPSPCCAALMPASVAVVSQGNVLPIQGDGNNASPLSSSATIG